MRWMHEHATAVCIATAFTFLLFGALSNWMYA